MRNITIKDVAKKAGVSTATVSRVLNKSDKVSAEAKHQVLSTMQNLNYRPNLLARSLKVEKTLTIGYLVSDISNMFFTQIMKGLESVTQTKGYTLLVCSTDNILAKEIAFIKTFLEKKVDGIVLNTSGGNDQFIAQISREIPVVLSNRNVCAEGFVGDFVDNDNVGDVFLLTTHLIEQGHKKIGVINGNLALSTGRERFEGYKKAMLTIGVTIEESYPYRYDGYYYSADGYNGARQLMCGKDRPTAIVIMNNEMTMGALAYFKEANITVPDDVSIVAYGDIEGRELLYVQPTIVENNYLALGTKLGEYILERINSESAINNREFRYSSGIVLGNSTARIN